MSNASMSVDAGRSSVALHTIQATLQRESIGLALRSVSAERQGGDALGAYANPLLAGHVEQGISQVEGGRQHWGNLRGVDVSYAELASNFQQHHLRPEVQGGVISEPEVRATYGMAVLHQDEAGGVILESAPGMAWARVPEHLTATFVPESPQLRNVVDLPGREISVRFDVAQLL